MSSGQVPQSLHEKFTLLRYFAQYMDENLTEGGEGGKAVKAGAGAGAVRPSSPNVAIPQIKRWIRAPKAIIMHLTNGTIQVRSSSSLLSLTRVAPSKIKRYLLYGLTTTFLPGQLLQGPHQAHRGRGAAVAGDLHQLRETVSLLGPDRPRQTWCLPPGEGEDDLRGQCDGGVR